MRTIKLLLLFFFVTFTTYAQPFANDWINYGQPYYKMLIQQDGLYRVTYQELQNAGFPVASTNPKFLQLYYYGKQMAIRVVGEADGSFDPTDYIEFYGFRNADLDWEFYEDKSLILNKNSDIYINQSFVFLTNGQTEGKRIATSNLSNDNQTPAQNHFQEIYFAPSFTFNKGQLYPENRVNGRDVGATPSHFIQGTGVSGAAYPAGAGDSFSFNLTNVTDTLPEIEFEMRFTGRINVLHEVDIFLSTDATKEVLVGTLTFSKYEVKGLKLKTKNFSFAKSNRLGVRFFSKAGGSAFVDITIRYPQSFDMGKSANFDVFLPANTVGKTTANLFNLAANTQVLDITDHHNIVSLGTTTTQNLIRIVANTNTKRHIKVLSQGLTVPKISLVNFKPIDLTTDYLIISHPRLMKPVGTYKDAVQAYADYRTSPEGGKYNAQVFNILDLYDQFSYGQISPLAIRNFANFMLRRGKPRFLFLVGRALNVGTVFHFRGEAATANWDVADLVPAWGITPSDHQLTAGLNGYPKFVPAIPTGRLSTITPQHVINYLNKVKEHEAQPMAAWKKNILHLSGGQTAQENARFRGFVDEYKRYAEGDFLGAKVKTLSKKTTDYVEVISIADEVNSGIGMITFFGHSNPQWTDIEVGKASDPTNRINNKGKYPMMIVNGCGSGDIYGYKISNGEDWINTADKGAILYFAHSSYGFDITQHYHAQYFYETAFTNKNLINKSVGEIIQENLRRFTKLYDDGVSIAQAQQFVLQGDPAVKLIASDKADYQITDASLFVKPANGTSLTAQSPTFLLGMAVANLGIVDKTPFKVKVKRTFADGSTVEYPAETFPAVRYLDSLYITIRQSTSDRQKAIGLNKIEVWIDSENQVAENNENNNYANIDFPFNQGNITAINPKEFSIISTQPVELIAQNSNRFSVARTFRFELDTTALFNSPLKKDTLTAAYITPRWATALPTVKDSTVFYWRVRYADLRTDDDSTWVNSSFIYIPKSPAGWSQSHFFQYQKNTFDQLKQNPQNRKWIFNASQNQISITAIGSQNPNWKNWELKINGQVVANGTSCTDSQLPNRLVLVAIDQETGRIYNPYPIGKSQCGAGLLVTMLEQGSAIFRGELSDYLNLIKTGDYVIAVNSPNVQYNGLGFAAQFAKIGLNPQTLAAEAVDGAAYIIIGQKGAALGTAITKAPDKAAANITSQSISLTHTLQHPVSSASMTSSLIGPAEKWTNLHFAFNGAENPQDESYQLDLIGVTNSLQEQLISRNVRQSGLDLSNIDANVYPYLKLRATLSDSKLKTPYLLQKWQVVFQEVPDGILLHDSTTYRERTVKEIIEGDSVALGFYFYNATGTNFRQKNLTVRYQIYNSTANTTRNILDTIAAPQPYQMTYFRTKFNSLDFRGDNRLIVEVNPRILPEQRYENNIVEANFKVKPDDINPVLQVVFDGKRILNGEIVQPTPTISVQLEDENKRFPFTNPQYIELFLKKCETCEFEKIDLTDADLVSWKSDKNGKLLLDFRPKSLAAGTYQLKVQGRDIIGNLAGFVPYEISFKVITENTVSNFYPYPNPTSGKMKFVFTLTGEMPENIRIQIMTISGKVVRTVSKDDLGNLRVGNNISDFTWDGTDEFGESLANGVYLYKVDIKSSSQTPYKSFETAQDGLFEKGYGKIYLMR